MKTKQFKVITVSSNTNSFGLKSIVLVAADGEAWQILKSPYGGSDLPKFGDVIEFETSGRSLQKYGYSFECPHRFADCPAKALKDIFTKEELEAAKPKLVERQEADFHAPFKSAFDVFEVRTVGNYTGHGGDGFSEVITEDYPAEEEGRESVCWSVYGHYKQGTTRCISDCDSFEAACELAVDLGGSKI